MKIDSIKIKNFRGYKDETKIELNDLIVFVGKNDIGKSTILDGYTGALKAPVRCSGDHLSGYRKSMFRM